jgi:hypothetical protein
LGGWPTLPFLLKRLTPMKLLSEVPNVSTKLFQISKIYYSLNRDLQN